MEKKYSNREFELAKKELLRKTTLELEAFIELTLIFDDWTYGLAMKEAAKQILLDRTDNLILGDI